ncbi:type II toxin-antitoxin system RelE/ParE family toxin [Paraflavitalea speifideaquila]|uniref:type II toxin-antitoxin system RelE/ParE family toxin n=1 Tax=Paraflavitalea speifideaquila TaxID=3076558 RepID=UPI0028E300A3|nr:type II toxin-antitoxin system RelE/ParE family toxin [Paraflavitalea speifideiaquila]
MSYSIEYLQKARLELVEAWEWYEDRQTGLGDKFKMSIDSCIRSIEQNPERYPERRKHYREGIIKTFPYLLVYRIHKRKKVIAIVSVFHTRRNPRKKYQ